ncbi:DUF6390 family protein [Fodinibacter luteus]|uniref:DUF6390 family protein n=1 Tax=Fodinibacter luteus TaxID=552064 RepID=A0ABP8JXZ8_9MICO
MPSALSGALRFAAYAYPPNALGYCGPDAAHQLLEQVAAGVDDPDLRRLARGFEGAWPYLELIAAANGIRDPLDPRVVEAYWVGNALLDRVGPRLLGDSLESRFRGRAGRSWARLAEAVPAGAVPHHSFHVLGIYPWVGLLREGRVDEPLHVLDRCRVRWGRVVELHGPRAVVASRPLVWDGRLLSLGAERPEEVLLRVDGLGLAGAVQVGDWCSLHWDWVCERLTPRQLAALHRRTGDQLAVANGTPYPAPAAVLG